MKNLKFLIACLSMVTVLSFNSNLLNAQNAQFEIAPDEYAELTAKALNHIADFAWSDFYDMLSEDMAFYLPDGGPKTRTGMIGKAANMAFWDSYEEKSGNSKIVVSDDVYVPLTSK